MTFPKLETAVGLFVAVGLAAVAYLAIGGGVSSMVGVGTYDLKARFTNSGGLNPGSTVVVSGVPVGRVVSIELDASDFAAIISLRVREDVRLPADTIASIKTNGLIGEKYVALAPGADEEVLTAGALITDTEAAVDLESLISRFAFGQVNSNSP